MCTVKATNAAQQEEENRFSYAYNLFPLVYVCIGIVYVYMQIIFKNDEHGEREKNKIQ